ncbi:HesB-like selenoprotein [Bhargavaea cecembensis DSE10]|uniref:HesB-like selenoprotein n=1 Tax=Bhargavaea cecembensis DSE10 TaxID=1235279 RepID=M7NE78_9BACL|nr:HesB-like selenoprotein [Bhargavaea cecembensis]EMR05577.1 HesB-like selenoprotein [Bhargavaea cecembensis DSE10]
MLITNEAKELLEPFLKERGLGGLRLTVETGEFGPQFAITFDEPQEFDVVQEIKGIRVAIDAQLSDTDLLTLDVEETPEGRGIVLRS